MSEELEEKLHTRRKKIPKDTSDKGLWSKIYKELLKFNNNYLVKNGLMTVTDQFSSVTQSCLTLCDSMNRSMPGLPVHHQLPEFIQTHVHRVGDAI